MSLFAMAVLSPIYMVYYLHYLLFCFVCNYLVESKLENFHISLVLVF